MREYIVLLDDGNTISVFADECEWNDDTIEFSVKEEPNNEYSSDITIAVFYTEHVIGWYRKYEEPNPGLGATKLLALGGKMNERIF